MGEVLGVGGRERVGRRMLEPEEATLISQEVIPRQGDLFFAKHYIREEH
jgi:hypothetical protein